MWSNGGRPERPVVVDHPCGQQVDLVPERGEQRAEAAVELVTEAAAAAHELVEQRLLRKDDLLAEMDAEVLERNGSLMRPLQVGDRIGVGVTDALEVGVNLRAVHEPSPK
jgi:hypothetical protein